MELHLTGNAGARCTNETTYLNPNGPASSPARSAECVPSERPRRWCVHCSWVYCGQTVLLILSDPDPTGLETRTQKMFEGKNIEYYIPLPERVKQRSVTTPPLTAGRDCSTSVSPKINPLMGACSASYVQRVSCPSYVRNGHELRDGLSMVQEEFDRIMNKCRWHQQYHTALSIRMARVARTLAF
jgi:hypothetical protein